MIRKPRQKKAKPQVQKAEAVELIEEDLDQTQGGERSLSDITFTSTINKASTRLG